MTDALTDAERLLRDWAKEVAPHNPQATGAWIAADALAAERERLVESNEGTDALLETILTEYMTEDAAQEAIPRIKRVLQLAAPPLPPATGEGELNDLRAIRMSGMMEPDQAQKSRAALDRVIDRLSATPEPSEAMVEAGESANDRFERLADEFYADTGLVAPGKDDAPECALSTTYEERVKVWKAWNAGRRRAALAAQEGSK